MAQPSAASFILSAALLSPRETIVTGLSEVPVTRPETAAAPAAAVTPKKRLLVNIGTSSSAAIGLATLITLGTRRQTIPGELVSAFGNLEDCFSRGPRPR